jgi:hypothetical protein
MENFLHQITHQWHFAFLLTLVLEVPVYILMTRRAVPVWRGALAGILCSTVTHPLLWFVWIRVMATIGYVLYAVSGELLVVAMETGILFLVCRRLKWHQAFLASLLANGFSFGIGLLFLLA